MRHRKGRALRHRYGRAKRKYGPPTGSWGSRRILGKWITYRGYTLDPWKAPKVEHSKATFEIRVHKGSGTVMEGNAYGETFDEAMVKAKRLVDAMHGD